MKDIYNRLWELARPYYEKGRPMDIDHIEWMMQDAFYTCEKESIDDTLILPLVILHDVGYANIEKGNPFQLDLRKAHMEEGAKIAREILDKIGYPEDKAEKISYYVSVHDNWALGDHEIYKDPILGIFNDFEFMWMATPKGFPALMKILDKSPQEMIEWLRINEKHKNRPFTTRTTRKLYESYLHDREAEQVL